jgi:hypothetical protein
MGQASIDDIVSNQGPAVAPPTAAAAAAPVSGTAHVDDIVSNQGPAPGSITEANQKYNQPFQPVPKDPVAPPQDHKEELVKSVGGDHGLAAYRAARKAVDGVELMIKAPAASYDAAKELVRNLGTDMLSNVKANLTETDPNHGQMYAAPIFPAPGVGTATQAFADTAPAVSTTAPIAAATTAPAGDSLMTRLTNPFKKWLATPKDAGAAATQEPTAAAVRDVTGSPASAPIVSREAGTTAADDMLNNLGVQKDAAYKKIDDIAEFDLKAEKQKLSDTKYAIKQPGADVKGLQEEMDLSNQKIADANKKLVKAGINPKDADELNKAWEATKLFKQDLVRATKADGTLDVNVLLKRANSRFNPRYGDRLAQAFGKGDAQAGKAIASKYIQGLEAAQAAGQHALSTQRFKLWLTGLGATAGIGSAGYKTLETLLAP